MEHIPQYDHTYYLTDYIRTDRLKALLPKLVRILKTVEFDAFAFRGNSGALVSVPLALKMNKTMLLVRKEKDCHSNRFVEGDLGARRYVIVDDTIATGRTVAAIVREINAVAPSAKCVGVLETGCGGKPNATLRDAYQFVEKLQTDF